MDDVSAARILISSLDLTSLNTTDTEKNIIDLCSKATTPFGNVAAVCVFPKFIPTAKNNLPLGVKIATVINFPAGIADINLLQREITSATALGADVLDVVFPYRTFLNHDIEFCQKYLTAARELCKRTKLKIIIESGELKTIDNIKLAANLCISAQADFIKTSTGKTPVSATPEAANAILETIAQSGKIIGFKASGGIKTFVDAKKYLTLSQSIMGPTWATNSRFRIGASSVLKDLIATIQRGY